MTARGDTWPYPHEPPQCLETGEACLGCPWVAEEACEFLNFGQEFQETLHDPLLPGFLTRHGLARAIERDKVLRGEILEGRVGVLELDFRGLSEINNKHGHVPFGDNFIKVGAARLTGNGEPGLLRTKSPSPEVANQRANPNLRDVLFCRGGDRSDEITGLVRDVTLEQFLAIFLRVRDRYSITRAIEDDRQGKIPVIACVGGAHGSMTYPSASDSSNVVVDYLQRLTAMADREAVQQRDNQYNILWSFACEVDPTLRDNTYATADPQLYKATVMREFLRCHCPNFAANARELLSAVH